MAIESGVKLSCTSYLEPKIIISFGSNFLVIVSQVTMTNQTIYRPNQPNKQSLSLLLHNILQGIVEGLPLKWIVTCANRTFVLKTNFTFCTWT